MHLERPNKFPYSNKREFLAADKSGNTIVIDKTFKSVMVANISSVLVAPYRFAVIVILLILRELVYPVHATFIAMIKDAIDLAEDFVRGVCHTLYWTAASILGICLGLSFVFLWVCVILAALRIMTIYVIPCFHYL